MLYQMKLQPEHFVHMKNGTKRIELRLNDEKRSKIQLGDEIEFLKEPHCDERFRVKVIGLLKYENFFDLIKDFNMEVLADSSVTKEELLNELQKFYSIEKQKEYGVLGIRIEKIMEYLEVVDEKNNITGQIEERDIIHQKGLWHREISVWIMNQKGEVLLQKRSAKKKQGANNWSTCAGHVDIGEAPKMTAIREIQEELGIKVQESELEHLFTEKVAVVLPNSYNNVFSYKYLLKTNAQIEDYKINLEEVSNIKYVSLAKIEQLMKDKPVDYPFASKDYMPKLLKELLKRHK